MQVTRTLEEITFTLTVMDPYGGIPGSGRLVLRTDGVHLRRHHGKLVWSFPWEQVHGVQYDATNLWLVGSNSAFLGSVDPLRMCAVEIKTVCAELDHFIGRYGGRSGETPPAIDPRILFLREEARTRNR